MKDCFYLFIFCPLCFFQRQNCYMKCAWKPTVYHLGYVEKNNYTINCINFWGTQGSVHDWLKCEIISRTNLKFLLRIKSIFDCINNYMLAQVVPRTRNKGSKFLKVKQPLVYPMLFICKYLQTYNVYSEIWGGVKKTKQNIRNKKMCIIHQDKTYFVK